MKATGKTTYNIKRIYIISLLVGNCKHFCFLEDIKVSISLFNKSVVEYVTSWISRWKDYRLLEIWRVTKAVIIYEIQKHKL